MNSETWQKVENLLNRALEIEPARRRAFLDEIGANDLRREVESLLDCDAKTNGFLQSQAIALSNDFFDADELADTHLNQKIGNYKIIREIGRGGMGAVFLAERADGEFEQKVALKIVRRLFGGKELERRFRRERQILASLNHPNIAQLHDGGISADGEPFLAMEFVEGIRINEFCDVNNLSTHERLKLFLDVCAAVSFAHQNLVVHQDLKPSNILVTKDGTPKLLDFGIAKLTDAEQAEEQTQTHFRAFTPEYASPEQINGEQVTTASDVYSLGILLADLLSGEPSAFGRWKSKEPADSERKTFVTNIPTKSEEKKSADAELNNIIAMARRKEPARRYASVAQFAEDINRYLDGLPVRAQRDSFTYRAGKFVKRNRLSVAALTLVILSLTGGIVVAVWQAGVAREQANIAEAYQKRSDIAAEKQKKITGFMEKVLSYASPAWYAEGNRFKEPARVIDVLHELSGKIETEFPDDPDIQAELHHKCAEIFLANQMLDRAERHARRALHLRRQVFGERHPEVAKDLYYLGEVLGSYGNIFQKENLHRQAAAIFRELAPDNANLPYLLEELAWVRMDFYGDFDEAENLYAQSLALHRRHSGEVHFNTARLYFHLSVVAAGRGEGERAEEMFREGEWRIAQLSNPELRLQPLIFRARLEFFKGNLAAAEAAVKQYLAECELKGCGGNGRNMRLLLLGIYDRQNDWAQAVEVQRTQIAYLQKQMPETNFPFGAALARLSVYLLRLGKMAEAGPHFAKALRIFQGDRLNAAGADDFRLDLSECLLRLNRRAEVVPLLQEMSEFYQANYPPNHSTRIRAENLLKQARPEI